MSGEFAKIKIEKFGDDFNEIVSGSCEDNTQATDGSSLGGHEPVRPAMLCRQLPWENKKH